MNIFADWLFRILLGWTGQTLNRGARALSDNADGIGSFFSAIWLPLLIVLIIFGVAMDNIMALIKRRNKRRSEKQQRLNKIAQKKQELEFQNQAVQEPYYYPEQEEYNYQDMQGQENVIYEQDYQGEQYIDQAYYNNYQEQIVYQENAVNGTYDESLYNPNYQPQHAEQEMYYYPVQDNAYVPSDTINVQDYAQNNQGQETAVFFPENYLQNDEQDNV